MALTFFLLYVFNIIIMIIISTVYSMYIMLLYVCCNYLFCGQKVLVLVVLVAMVVVVVAAVCWISEDCMDFYGGFVWSIALLLLLYFSCWHFSFCSWLYFRFGKKNIFFLCSGLLVFFWFFFFFCNKKLFCATKSKNWFLF